MMMFVLPVVLLAEFFSGSGTPAIIKYSPELCGMAAAAFVVIHSVRHGFARIRFIYWALIALIALHVLFGIIANDVKAGTVIVGGRLYLRTIPFFLLAITLTPSESKLKKQFLLVLGIAVLQLPVSVYQKVSSYQRALTEGYITMTGDWVVGTLGISSFLSLFLICFSAVIVALYAKKIISFAWAASILLIVLVPTMINETKATFLLAPVAIAVPMLAAAGKHWAKMGAKTLILLIGFASIFIPVYDYFIMPRWGYGLIDFFTMEGRVEGYLSKDAQVGTTGPAGRLDSITVAADVLSRDPTSTVFGLGMGSVTESALGPRFEGQYYTRYGAFVGTTYARLFWELGFLGAALVLFLLFLIFIDARRSYKQQGPYGVLALSYLAIIPIMVAGMMYNDLVRSPGIGVCFWYYCGLIAATAQLQTSQLAASSNITGQTRVQLSEAHVAEGLGSTSAHVPKDNAINAPKRPTQPSRN